MGENTIKDRFYIPKMEFYLKKWEAVVQVYNLSKKNALLCDII